MPTYADHRWGPSTRPASRWATRRRPKPRRKHQLDGLMLGAVVVLVGLGALNLVTIGEEGLALRHVLVAGGGIVVLAVATRVRFSLLPLLGWGLYGVSLLALVAVLLAEPLARGTRRWLELGPVTVQPSELAKVGLVLVLALVLGSGYTWRRFLLAGGLAAVPIGLVMIQPDLSTGLVMAAVAGFIVILARVPVLPLLPVFGAALAALPLAVLLLRPYQLGRLEAFLQGTRDAEGPGWAMLQAEIAVALGGLTGSAREPLHDLRVQYLPEAEHDLAFASLVHSWGLLAGLLVAAAVLAIVWRAAVISRIARPPALALIAGGVAALVGVQTVVSIAANLGLLPHTGLPIPLFSYGGTAAVVHLGAFGLVIAAARNTKARWSLWDPPEQRRTRPRWARSGALVLTASLLVLSYFTWNTQERRGAELSAVSEQQMTRCLRLPAERGIIEDREGRPLVANSEDYDVRVIRGLLPDDDAERLATLVDQPEETVTTALAESGNELDVKVATVSEDVAANVLDEDLPGVLVAPAERRDYPHGRLLGPLLGYVGVGTPEDMERWPELPLGATVGRAGLERQYDEALRGTDGRQCVYVEPLGRAVGVASRSDPRPGTDLRLHLDLELQEIATEALATAVADSGGDLGAAVVMDAQTGAVIALASVPSYDNNVYVPPVDMAELQAEEESPGYPMLHHATQLGAPPGSTFKLVTAAANAEYEVIPPSRIVPTGASYTLGDHTFANWQPMPPQNLVEAIAWSNNVYFYDLAWRLGAERLLDVAQRLGVGERTGIDLPGESPGVLSTPESVTSAGGVWYPGATVILGIGQGPVVATPLQVARWTAGIASGSLITPRLADVSASGLDDDLADPEPERLDFADRLGPVRDGMRAAVTGGTAAQLRELPVEAGGKTGSAQNPASPLGEPDSWFTAVAPMDDPGLVVTVYVRGGGMGSATSGPVARQILEHYYD